MKISPAYSPVAQIKLLINAGAIAKKMKRYDSKWFLSKHGAKEYENLNSPAERINFYFDYLNSISNNQNIKDSLYKLAFLMATYVEKTNFEFSKYPQILDPKINPLISCVENFGSNQAANALRLLASLKNIDPKLLSNFKKKPYTYLTFCDNELNDSYKLERAIIGLYCTDFSDNYVMPPYLYSILSEDIEDEDIDDEDVDDEDIDDEDVEDEDIDDEDVDDEDVDDEDVEDEDIDDEDVEDEDIDDEDVEDEDIEDEDIYN